MRNKLLVLLGFVILIGCQKTNESNFNVDSSKINKFFNLPINFARLAYGDLTAEEKRFIWISTISVFVQEKKINYEQKILIDELKQKINNIHLFDSEYEIKIFTNIFQKKWASAAITKFSQSEINALVNQPKIKIQGDIITFRDFSPTYVDPSSATLPCDCHCGSWVSCNASTWCQAVSCEKSNSGCGWLWLESCNGRCGPNYRAECES